MSLGPKTWPSASVGFEIVTVRVGVDVLSHCATLPALHLNGVLKVYLNHFI